MRTHSIIRNSMLATGLMLAAAVIPFSQVLAQDATPIQKSSDNQTVPDKAADAWITTKVKSEFGTTKGIKATAISVSTNDGVVTLSGNVGSQDEKMHAERVAQLVKGVKSVDVSRLTVGGMPSEQQ
ncbi:phospholipid-binding protein [Rhodanobacter panaciterrae]|uniref:Phospholipid-binding protein n=1 Tax=Rhodanobacter panaciterrae TaxID=490572 RepID=A0ABQ2ZHP4_9GAMM|nr:BON domain-containing protein [Rhodanobacter panaciterrae]GGY15486.1 phospholipid-binding protein [Rhodanobacter panaciterrae]